MEKFSNKLKTALLNKQKSTKWLASQMDMAEEEIQDKIRDDSFDNIEKFFISNELNLLKSNIQYLVNNT